MHGIEGKMGPRASVILEEQEGISQRGFVGITQPFPVDFARAENEGQSHTRRATAGVVFCYLDCSQSATN